MSLKTTLQHLFAWLEKEFSIVEHKIAPVVVTVLQHIKQEIDNGDIGFLAKAADFILKSSLPTDLANGFVAIFNNKYANAMAAALALEGLPINPTPEQIADLEQKIVTAMGLKTTNTSAVWTKAGTDLLQELKAFAASDKQDTFANDVIELERCFQIMKVDLSE